MTDLRIFDPTKVRGIVEDLTRRAESAEQRVAALEAALGELVELKGLKDRIEGLVGLKHFDERAALHEEYARRKPLAWAAARALSPGQPEPKMDGGA